MNLREFTRRLVHGASEEPGRYERLKAGRVDYAYRILWTKLARDWEPAQRERVADGVRRVLALPDFEKNPVERRFEVAELADGLAHSGASLVALVEVLRALEAYDADSRDPN